MALSATHYPESGLTFGIMYGSTFTIEKTILEKLQSISFEAAHPLLLPGIFAELELSRHTRLVENSVNEVETKIFELNFQSGNVREYSRTEVEKRNIAKRTAWLDLTYLRNSITTWSTQLLKLAEHAHTLNRELYTIAETATPFAADVTHSHSGYARVGMQVDHATAPLEIGRTSRLLERGNSKECSDLQHSSPDRMSRPLKRPQSLDIVSTNKDYIDITLDCKDPNSVKEQMQKTGDKIKSRLAAIRDEYDEKTRDCTMRVDGMAMATQWVRNTTLAKLCLVDLYSRIARPQSKLHSLRIKTRGSCDPSLW
jgi:hypothetical protein